LTFSIENRVSNMPDVKTRQRSMSCSSNASKQSEMHSAHCT